MPGVLIASDRQYHEALRSVFAAGGQPVRCCTSAGEARRALCDGDFSLLVINAPLPDEFGRDLAAQAVHDGMDSILLCAAPQADKVAAGLEKYGVYVLSKPLSRQQAAFALRVIRTGRQRMRQTPGRSTGGFPGEMCSGALLRHDRRAGPPCHRKAGDGWACFQP